MRFVSYIAPIHINAKDELEAKEKVLKELHDNFPDSILIYKVTEKDDAVHNKLKGGHD